MKHWKEELAYFYKNKIYMMMLALTALCSYGFKVTHITIGIDDTPYAYYFEEGLAAIVGRWVLFLLNKVVSIAEFAPLLTDLAAVLLLMAAVTVWAALFHSVLGDKVPKFGYYFFACISLSCPLISEVFTYFLHNGIAIGYLCCGISLCCFREGLQKENGKKRMLPFALTAVMLWIALGCYESFMVVWLLGVFLLLLSVRLAGERKKVFLSLCVAAVLAVVALVLRSIMIALVTKAFGLESLQDEAVQRSIAEMAGWLLEPGALSEFGMVLKRVFVMYGVFAYAYYPIAVFLMASLVIAVVGIWKTIRQRDGWIILLTIGSFVVSFLLVVIEGKATLYRSAQFLPILCGFGVLLAAYAVRNLPALCRGILVAVLVVILWNQCADMNKWFYVDYQKYESAKATMEQVAYELDKNFDVGKPIVFTSTYAVPQPIVKDAYVAYGSETFYKMKRITDMVDEHLLEKFYRDNGVWVAQTPALSVIDWGRYAFGDDSELVRFFEMHGYSLVPQKDVDVYEEAEQYALTLPHFPKSGSIVDRGDYILVNL